MSTPELAPTACSLCYANCGILVQVDDGHMVKVRGDKDHPASRGYLCNKASRLDYYQNGRDRISSPLRRRHDGTFEEIDWDTAIAEVAERFRQAGDDRPAEWAGAELSGRVGQIGHVRSAAQRIDRHRGS